MSRPFFSVITPALNARAFLPRNLASVRAQGMAPGEVEHWVIDGGSKDGTVEWLEAQADLKFISEKDRGLSDAVNKGIARATGEWILWLNADDELAPGAMAKFKAATARFPDARVFCGTEELRGYDGTVEEVLPPWDYNLKELLGTRIAINQAATWVHRSVYERVGVLDVGIRYAMDYEWTVRAMKEFRCQPIPDVLAIYHRRPGSLMDAHMAAHYETFLRVRRKLGLGYFDRGEFNIRFYLLTEPLRRQRWLRSLVRRIKGLFGCAPAHPLPPAS
ncbi:MAG: glycosyltransferase family 2 protein [Limisphaerales bacterium]